MSIEFKYKLGEEILFRGKSYKIIFGIYNPKYTEPFYGILDNGTYNVSWIISPEQIERFFQIPYYIDVEIIANISDYYGQRYSWLDEKDIRKQ